MTSTLLALFDAEMTRTAAVLRALPDDGLDWAPHPRSYPLGRLAMHVASLPGWMRAYTTRDDYDMGEGGPGPATPASVAEVLDAFAEAAMRGRAVLAACTDEQLRQPWTLRRDGAVVVGMTRGEAIATFALQHLAHHRGQLTVYLRMLDRPVPPLYGDSADARLLSTEPPATASTARPERA
jgi:uncharacterized damage-inducible protein DinB